MSTTPFGPSLDQLGADPGDSAITGTDLNGLQIQDIISSNNLSVPLGLAQTSTFDPTLQLVDPTNTGDTGVHNNTSTPLLPSVNNPETAGSSLASTLNAAINTGFAAWQLSSQPAGTPKVVTTKVGATTVTSGAAPSILGSLFGGTAATPAAASQQNLILIIILLVVGLLIYRAVR